MAFCPNCGSEIPGSAVFCPNCGASNAQASAPAEPAVAAVVPVAGPAPSQQYAAPQQTYNPQPQQQYQQPGQQQYQQPQQTYQQPYTATPSYSKSKIAAGLFALFLGCFGIHKFYLGYTKEGIIMILITVLGAFIAIGPLVTAVIAIVEGIMYLTKSDQEFDSIYVQNQKPWL